MSDLWRYEAEIVPGEKPYIHFRHEADGRWVFFKDYDDITRQLAEARADIEVLVKLKQFEQDRADAALARAEADAALLDSGRILIHGRDEFGEAQIVEHIGLNLRAAIQAAIDAIAQHQEGKANG